MSYITGLSPASEEAAIERFGFLRILIIKKEKSMNLWESKFSYL